MITYELSLERQNLLGADKFSIAAESNETISFRFHFDKSWRNFDTKAAVFKSSDGHYYVLDITGNCVTVPWEVLRSTYGFELAVVAYEDEVVLTSKKVEIAVASSLLPETCRQLSPTETLFGRLMNEARIAAFAEYEDEIERLNNVHEDELLELGEEIEAERQSKAAAIAQKNSEIAELNSQASARENNLQAQIAALQAELAIKNPKAENWDMVNTALSQKTSNYNPLWGGGSSPFDLPMLNTSSMTVFNGDGFSAYIRKAGFDLTSATAISGAFKNKSNLEEISFVNSGNITGLRDSFNGCTHLKEITFGDLSSLSNMEYTFLNCVCLEKVTLGTFRSLSAVTQTFNGCRSLKEINAVFDTTLCRNFSATFAGCSSLETIRFAESTIRASVDFAACVNLSKESIYSIANGVCGEVSATVTFAEHAFRTNLSAAERTEIYGIIRDTKGWTVMLA